MSVAPVARGDAEVAPETGVGGGGREREVAAGERAVEPARERSEPVVHVVALRLARVSLMQFYTDMQRHPRALAVPPASPRWRRCSQRLRRRSRRRRADEAAPGDDRRAEHRGRLATSKSPRAATSSSAATTSTIFADLLKYNREFGRLEADGGVRLQQGGDRFFGPRLRYDMQDAHRRARGADRSRCGGEQTARGGADAHRVPRPRPLPPARRALHHLRAGARGLGDRWRRPSTSTYSRPGRRRAQRAAALLRHARSSARRTSASR